MPVDLFHPLICQWFTSRFGEPTPPQRLGWPPIAAGQDTLIAAPTGSGKTLAAFLVCLDRLLRQWLSGELNDGVQVVYVSPLRALSNDIQRNLQTPLAEIAELAAQAGAGRWPVRTAVRTGDTPAGQRAALSRKPPHIVVTTPESLYLLLTAQRSREQLRTVHTVIVDEIHALARDKRGSHLALSLERLAALCPRRPVRIGLSATQKPLEEIAAFLVGNAAERGPVIVDVGHARDLDLGLELPVQELAAVCSHEHWAEVYQRLETLIQSHRSSLIFVNTRRMAERVAFRLTERLGEHAVASHHGSLSREIRLDAEQRLKSGQLRAIVATASLELGIDVGYIDLVCQIGSPRSIATFLQRVGRSGHAVGALPKGRLFPLTRDELLECLALVRAVRRGVLDRIEIPEAPLDILAQQIVAEVAAQEWDEEALYHCFRQAYPYRRLSRDDFEAIVRLVSEGFARFSRAGAYLHRDRMSGRLRPRRHARLAALTSGGAIPDTAQYRVVTEGDETLVGTVDEDFALESLAGDIFLLGNSSWRIRHVRGDQVTVVDAQGAPPTIPFWLGEAPGRTAELSAELSELRQAIASRLGPGPAAGESSCSAQEREAVVWLCSECGCHPEAAEQAVAYVAAQQAALGLVPTAGQIVFERFFDESGGMQLVIHAPLGTRINKAWGLALRKRFCRTFDFELQAAADDNGVLLSLGPQHSFPIEALFSMLTPHNGRHLLEQAVLAVPLFEIRWRWNATRSLAVLRQQGGKRVPPFLQKFRSADLLAAAFPETVGCFENHHGDVKIPDHPLVRQTLHDCLTEALDVERWLALLADIQSKKVTLVPVDTREPSPFCHGLLNAQPYAFLDDAPLEERRTRALSVRRGLDREALTDLSRLDPAAIAQVAEEAWPLVRDAEELQEALLQLVVLPLAELREWQPHFAALVAQGRAAVVRLPSGQPMAIAAERWPLVRAVYPTASIDPEPQLPARLREQRWEPADARVEIIHGQVACRGPVTADGLAQQLALEPSAVWAALEALEASGVVLRGRFTTAALRSAGDGSTAPSAAILKPANVEWCERRLLARIHRLTLDGLRRRIAPVPPQVYWRYLVELHQLHEDQRRQGSVGVRSVVAQLAGYELPAGVWESKVLASRLADYDPAWLEEWLLSGEGIWGRLRPPRRDEAEGTLAAALNRSTPIALAARDDLPWLVPPDRPDLAVAAGSQARQVLAVLQARGALFLRDLAALTGLLPTQVEAALKELAALGLVSSDSFDAVRATDRQRTRNRPGRKVAGRVLSTVGRWSLFPGPLPPVEPPQRLESWCRLLLARYGVLFRDLLLREPLAPPWGELVRVLRRMELRGEVRGGRFIAGVAGEQFALEGAVERLRDLREAPDEPHWVLISAVDPLNLTGLWDGGPRVPANHKNSLVLQNGRCVAAKIAGRIEIRVPLDPAEEPHIRRSLQVGRKLRPPAPLALGSEEPGRLPSRLARSLPIPKTRGTIPWPGRWPRR
jgi:ATP-dependent Lhr-like helicase